MIWQPFRLFTLVFLLAILTAWIGNAYGQALSATAVGITCPASGSSIEVLATNARRTSWSLINDSVTDIRMGFLASGTATLTDSNSVIIKAGASYADSLPNVYAGRIVCMSTTAGAIVVHRTEAQK